MNYTKFYIMIPVYNVERYLDKCLESILSQDYTEFEVILVDDGSKDSSGTICDRYAAENDRIHVIHQQNQGQIYARLSAINYVLNNCEYKDTYSIFVDSDDELKSGALAKINQEIQSSSCDMLIYGYEKFNNNGIVYTTLEERTEEKLIDAIGELFREVILEHNYNSLCRKAIRTEMLFFDVEDKIKAIKMGEDFLHSLGVYRQNPHTLIIPNILYRYRINAESVTQRLSAKQIEDELTSRHYAIDFIKRLNIWNDNDFVRYIEKSIIVLQWDIRHILTKSTSRKDALKQLNSVYEHQFVQEYCLDRISKKSSIWLKQFSKARFNTLWLLNKISVIKNAIKEK